MSTSNASKQAQFRQRKRELGIVPATYLVPERDRHRLKAYAAGLCRAYEKEQKPTNGGNSGTDAE